VAVHGCGLPPLPLVLLPGLIGGFGLGICAGARVPARVANRTSGNILAAALRHGIDNVTSATAAGRGVIGAAGIVTIAGCAVRLKKPPA
jgi:hypothetical protein